MKNILIIGASSGIGKAIRSKLEHSGHTVYSTYNTHQPEDLERSQQFDVLSDSPESLDLPETLDGVVYCPGSIALKPFSRLKTEDLKKDMHLQVYGAVSILQHVMPKLKAGSSPSVVFFSTVAVQNGFNYHSQVAMAKGALEGLTRSLAAEFSPTIRFNAIAPSLTDTPLASSLLNTEQKRTANAERHPMKRIGTPADIANMAAFLLSDDSTWITGQVHHVDGGMSHIRG
jgi:NAD(P)-dependent dehydrogenase (short-subunit alcohol dehydrogenase family)